MKRDYSLLLQKNVAPVPQLYTSETCAQPLIPCRPFPFKSRVFFNRLHAFFLFVLLVLGRGPDSSHRFQWNFRAPSVQNITEHDEQVPPFTLLLQLRLSTHWSLSKQVCHRSVLWNAWRLALQKTQAKRERVEAESSGWKGG